MNKYVEKLYKYFIFYYGRTHSYRCGKDMFVEFDYPHCPFTLGIRTSIYGITVWHVDRFKW